MKERDPHGKFEKTAPSLLVCLTLAVPSWFLGHAFPVIGGPVFAILAGMIVAMIIGSRTVLQPGITCVSLIAASGRSAVSPITIKIL